MIGRYVVELREVDAGHGAVVGGKGAALGALTRIDGIRVPAGFCVTTDAFRRVVVPAVADRVDRLARLDPGDGAAVRHNHPG